jgi:hypothetical protein
MPRMAEQQFCCNYLQRLRLREVKAFVTYGAKGLRQREKRRHEGAFRSLELQQN